MSLLPRSLFGRNLLLMVVLFLIGQIVTGGLFYGLVMRPRVQSTADAMVRTLESLEEGLRDLDPARRRQFVERFNAREGLWQAPQGTRVSRLERVYLQQIEERVAARGARLVRLQGAGHTLGLELVLDGERYLLGVPSLIPAREFPWAWLSGSAATGLLAVLGAWLIQRRIDRPLRDVVGAARELGQGRRPARLNEDGPSEIAVVAHGFNEMVSSLAANERERALMLAGLSHDLRTPLAKMRLAAELLAGQGDADLLASLHRNVEAVDRLLSQFLEFVRAGPDAGGHAEPMVGCDLNGLARDALAVCAQHTASAEPVLLQPGAVPALPLRQESVRRLIQNLVINAQGYGAPPIEVVTGRSGDRVWLEVRDRGPGIPPGRVEELKQPFRRGDDARGGPAGAGLGLAIVERIARDHGARFELRQREGGGLVARVEWSVGDGA